MQTLIEWMPYTVMPDGHRFYPLSARNDGGADSWFTDRSLPMVAIADDSGELPQDTQDGIMWLDFGRHLMAGSPLSAEGMFDPPSIPLLTDDGSESRTITDDPTMLMLSHKYRWGINAHGILFTAHRVDHRKAE